MPYVFDPPEPTSVAVAGSTARFPVHRIYCVGRNYGDHAREMGHDPDAEPPFFFMKPADALVANPGTMPYPRCTGELHHEVELVVALRAGGADIPLEDAEGRVFGYGVGLDLTRRDVQNEAKSMGRPWDASKGFDLSAPCSKLHPHENIGHPRDGAITLEVNGDVRQTGDLDQMIWKVPEIIAELSRWFELTAGDLIYTGTPAGVGPVHPGDRLTAKVAGVATMTLALE